MLSSHHRVVLVADDRPAPSPGVRRYRLARIAVNPEAGAAREGFDHLKRAYD
ncbi:MAG: hypothetical protein QOE65_2573 [Solirubrobacteraceae bacterium]|jgi:hypothetical protein|nr:hypothetical protein [Solirubrobacteraceae bacterium]